MFTGLIEQVGEVARAVPTGDQRRLAIRCGVRDFVTGESIAVNGVCLTVEFFTPGEFTAYASAETVKRTNIGALAPGSKVNLERALVLGDRLGGHMVSGHVDCLAKITESNRAGESTRFVAAYDAAFDPLVVEKGSVALDGVSLTVNECGQGWLAVNVIPATQAETTIGGWKPGSQINMELDVIGKYVQQMVAPYAKASGQTNAGGEGLSMEKLLRHGF
ncbi:MAG: riboflavin synthase [Desulfovibrionaceae bacterium]